MKTEKLASYCRWIFICCLLLMQGCQPGATPGTIVQIERVVSGQSFEWVDSSKQPPRLERVRLIGIETPDWRQRPWGPEAKKRLEQMIGKVKGQQTVLKPVLLESDVETVDRFGRRLAYVWKDGVLLNEQLVKEGYVLVVSLTPNKKYHSRLVRAQEYARLMGKGIWNPDNPMRLTPTEFQRQNQ